MISSSSLLHHTPVPTWETDSWLGLCQLSNYAKDYSDNLTAWAAATPDLALFMQLQQTPVLFTEYHLSEAEGKFLFWLQEQQTEGRKVWNFFFQLFLRNSYYSLTTFIIIIIIVFEAKKEGPGVQVGYLCGSNSIFPRHNQKSSS